MDRMRRRLIVLPAVVLALLAAAAVAWWRHTPAVPALEVRAAPLVRSLQFSGRVATSSRVDLGSTVTGRVAQVLVQEGARVHRGDVLVQLDADELRAALAQALAGEQQANARLTGLRDTGRRGADASLAQAESNLLAARADLQRQQALVDQGFISASRLDEARRAVAVTQAQVDGAAALRLATADSGTDVMQARAQAAQAAAATQAAQARLAQASIVAPASARVLQRLAEPGQIVQPGRVLLTLALDTGVQLKAQVDERYLDQLAPGQTAAVVADAYPTRRFAARVASIAPLVDAQRGAVEVKLEPLPPLPAFLREDMTLSIEVETARREKAISVPVTALRGEDRAAPAGQAVVHVIREGRVQARPVRTGLRTLEAVEIVEGLAAGDLVVLGPVRPLGSRARADAQATVAAIKAPADSAAATLTNTMGR